MSFGLRLFLLAALAVAITGCGRKGPPLTPYESAVEQAEKNEVPPPERPQTDRPFVLDGLLD